MRWQSLKRSASPWPWTTGRRAGRDTFGWAIVGRGGSRATILLRPEPRHERRHWAVAHEIGEHVAHRVFAGWGADPREGRQRPRTGGELPGGPAAAADPVVCRRRGRVPMGFARPEGPLQHGQPRVDRPANVGVSAGGGHQHFRPAAAFISPQQRLRPGAAAVAGGNRVLERRPRAPRSATDPPRLVSRSGVADP